MESYIADFEEEGDRAKKLVGANVTDLSDVHIFVTARRDMIYAHSNFVKDECYYPTKLRTNQPRAIEIIAANLVATAEDLEDPYFMSRFWRLMVDDFRFFVDEIVVSTPRYQFLDFSQLANVTVIHTDGSSSPFAEWNRQRSEQDARRAEVIVPKNPWIPGLFYLFVLIAVLLTLRFITGPLGPFLLPVLIVGGLLAVSVIGAFTLRNQQLLKEKNFLELMVVALSYLPIMGNLLKRKKPNDPDPRAT